MHCAKKYSPFTTHQYIFAGKDAIMLLEEQMIQKIGNFANQKNNKMQRN